LRWGNKAFDAPQVSVGGRPIHASKPPAFLMQQRSWPATFGCSGPYKNTDDRSTTAEPSRKATVPPLCGLSVDISMPVDC